MASNKHLMSLVASLAKYRRDSILCDVTIFVDDGELLAHGAILAAASPVLETSIIGQTLPHIVRIQNTNTVVFGLALDAIYTGRLKFDESNCSHEVDVKALLHHLQVDVEQMEQDTVNRMKSEIEHFDLKNFEPKSFDRATFTEPKCFDGSPIIGPKGFDRAPITEPKSFDRAPIIEPMSQSNDAPVTENLDDAMDHLSERRIADTEMLSSSDLEQPDGDVSGDDDLGKHRDVDDLSKSSELAVSSKNEATCKCQFKCQVSTTEKETLSARYRAMCYTRQRIFLASLMDFKMNIPSKHLRSKSKQPDVSTKYFLEHSEAGKHIRVCGKTFCKVFGVSSVMLASIRDRIRTNRGLVDRRGSGRGRHKLCRSKSAIEGVDNQELDSSCSEVASIVTTMKQINQINTEEQLSVIKAETSASDSISSVTTSSQCDCRQCRGTFRCDFCSFNALTRHDLLVHRARCKKVPRDLIETNPVVIGNIQQPAVNGDKLDITDVKAFNCSMCSEIFESPGGLSKHLLIHRTSKEHMCDICQKKLSSRLCLQQHRLVHLVDAPIVCEHCGATFKSKHSLKGHNNRSHSATKEIIDLKCALCPRTFTRKLNFFKHTEKVHGVISEHRARMKSFVCDKCGTHLGSKDYLHKHRKRGCSGS